MKILLSAPTSVHKDYCMKDWINWITSPDFSDVDIDILIVDNSPDPTYHFKIAKELGSKGTVLHIPYKKDRDLYHTIAESNEMIRNFFLAKDYDFLFFNESDQFVPKKSIDYLLSLSLSVVGLPYFIKQHYGSLLISHHPIEAGYKRDVAINTLNTSFIEFDGKIKPDRNTGLGALLIHKNVLSITDFTIDEEMNLKENAWSDTYFQNRLEQKGFKIYQVKKYMSLHLNKDWSKLNKN